MSVAIGLYNPKSNVNVGSVLRTAFNYNVDLIAIQGKRYKRSCTDTTAAYGHIPLIHTDNLHSVIPFDHVPIGVELVEGARNILDFTHFDNSFYVFGPEDGSLSKEILSWVKTIIYIPSTQCLNLGICVSTVLYDRMLKKYQNKNLNHRINQKINSNGPVCQYTK